jgi:DNA invertase Pin-like site-specific DNA recombinase
MTDILHIYTRVSSLIQQEEGTSLENQKQLGIKKANELGFGSRIWNEGGQSSFHDDLNNRPVIVSLLSLIESGTIKHLFVYNTDRLSRNQQTWAVIRYKLLTHGVTLHTASGQMQLKNPVDDLMLGILSEISQYDNRIRSERSRFGRFQKVQQGNWKGGPPPFGYRLEHKQLVVDTFESEWIKKIYDWYCHGESVKDIQSKLSSHGVLTRRSNAKWSIGSIQFILRNPVYIGYFDYTDKLIGETVRVITPAIIDAQVFQVAHKKRTGSRDQRTRNSLRKHFYLLTDVLVCGHCGHAMGGRIYKTGHQHLYYCVKKERDWTHRGSDHPRWQRGANCSMVRSINIEKTNQLVWEMIKPIIEKIGEHSSSSGNHDFLHSPSFDDRDGILTAELPWISARQIELLPDEEQKKFISTILSKVSVFFDAETKKHRLDVEFTETVSRLLEANREVQNNSGNSDEVTSDITAAVGEDGETTLRGDRVKKSAGSGITFAAEQN